MEDQTVCRICLGHADIPIYGEGDQSSLAEDIQTIGDIQLSKYDDNPKHICDTCYQLLESAILFRNTAKETELFLMNSELSDEEIIGRTGHNKEGIDEENIVIIVSDNHKVPDQLVSTENNEVQTRSHSSNEISLLMQECSTCGIQFASIEDFERHCQTIEHEEALENITNKTKVKCTVCDKSITKSYYQQHIKLHENKEEELRKCPYCEKTVCNSYLKAHIKRIHHEKLIKETKKEAVDTNNIKSKVTQLICDKCGKAFKRKYALNLHLLTHGTEHKFKCMFCPYKGRHSGLLKIHIRTHTGDYNYKCTKCPARFITKSNLNKHLKRHIGPVDFKCEICDKCFYTKPDLNKHYDAIHLGLKKFVCNICGKAFSFRNNMMCHQLKVHKRVKLTDGKGRIANYLKDEHKQAHEHDVNDEENITSVK